MVYLVKDHGGFYTIGALKTNRILYPHGFKQKLSVFAAGLSKRNRAVSLMTICRRNYHIYRYEGNLNGVENAVVLLSYPQGAFHEPKALRAFISTDASLSTEEILAQYTAKWPVDVFFRQSKNVLAFDRYQIRSSKGIRRYWLIMSLAHLLCCTGTGKVEPFEEVYAFFQRKMKEEPVTFLYQCGKRQVPLETVLALVG